MCPTSTAALHICSVLLLFKLMMLNVQWLLLPACVCPALKCTAMQYAKTNQPTATNVCHLCDTLRFIVNTCSDGRATICIRMPGPAGHSVACNAPHQQVCHLQLTDHGCVPLVGGGMSSGSSWQGAVPSYERADPRQAFPGAQAGHPDC